MALVLCIELQGNRDNRVQSRLKQRYRILHVFVFGQVLYSAESYCLQRTRLVTAGIKR